MWLWILCNDCGYEGEAIGVWIGDGYDYSDFAGQNPVCVEERHDFDVLGGA